MTKLVYRTLTVTVNKAVHVFELVMLPLQLIMLLIWKKINQIQRPKNLAANRFLSKRITSNHLQKTIQKLDYRKL